MKFIYSLLLTFFIASSSFAQSYTEVNEESSFKDRIYVGGGLGLQFGTYTYIDVSPRVGYKINTRLSAGVGGTYRYIKRNDNIYNYETNSYGYNVFAIHTIGNQLFVQAEFENLNFEYFYSNGEKRREWVPGTFLGGGLFQPMGRNAGVSVTALYNFSYDEVRSPYSSPFIFRVGISAGF